MSITDVLSLTHTWMYCVYVYACMYVRAYLCNVVYMYVCMYVCMHACMHAQTNPMQHMLRIVGS